jgi:hypothetical protein
MADFCGRLTSGGRLSRVQQASCGLFARASFTIMLSVTPGAHHLPQGKSTMEPRNWVACVIPACRFAHAGYSLMHRSEVFGSRRNMRAT